MRIAALLVLISGATFWGLNAAASKLLFAPGPVHFNGFELYIARSSWALPLFVAMALFAWPKHRIRKRDAGKLALCGVLYGPLCTGFYAVGVQHTSVAHAVLLFSLAPPITAAVAAWVLRERLTAIRVYALIVGILGTAILTFTRSASGSTIFGDGMVLVMVTAIAITTVVVRNLSRRDYGPIFVTGAYGAIGTSIGLIVGIAGGNAGAILRPLQPDPGTLFWFFVVIVIGLSAFAQFAQTYALKTIDAALVSVIGSYYSLLVGVGASIFIVHETISAWGFVAGGMLSIALGLAIVPADARHQRTAEYARSSASEPVSISTK